MYSYYEAHQHDGNHSDHGAGKNIDQVVTAFGQRGDNHEGIRDCDQRKQQEHASERISDNDPQCCVVGWKRHQPL